jgi:antirestriction protein ArdC
MARPQHTAAKRDHYQELTDKIITALEAGTRPWQKPWDPNKAGGPAMPVNAATGRRYRGINTLALGISTLAFANDDPRWCSYKQAAERGWQVRRGEKGTTVYFFKQLEIEDRNAPEDDTSHTKRIPLLRSFTVFHASQIDGIPAFTPPAAEDTPWRRPDAVDTILRNSKAVIRIGGDRAFYSPASDTIHLPPENSFKSPEGWAATALHELAHHSGAPHRLNRDLTGRFGSLAYAREELVGDLASYFMGSQLGLPTDVPNHASYIQSWIKILKNEKREIFRAAAAAQKCADYCLAFHPDYAASIQDKMEPQDGETRIAA